MATSISAAPAPSPATNNESQAQVYGQPPFPGNNAAIPPSANCSLYVGELGIVLS